MKHSFRFLTLALTAMLLLSAAGPALAADDSKVFIPATIDRLGLPEMPDALSLKTATDKAVMKDQWGDTVYKTGSCGLPITDYNDNYIPVYGTAENAVIHVQFSEKPDWAYIVWPEGNENLELDDTGYAEVQTYGHLRQPGTWVWNDPNTVCDPVTGEIIWRRCAGRQASYLPTCWGNLTYRDVKEDVTASDPQNQYPDGQYPDGQYPDGQYPDGSQCPYVDPTGAAQGQPYPTDGYDEWYQYWERYYQYCVAPETAHITGGDYAYMAGKGNVAAQYGRSGVIYYIEYTVQQDFFRTGKEGAYSVIRYEPVSLVNYNRLQEKQRTTVWYISSVKTTYPAQRGIVGVEAYYRNDKAKSLASYKILYQIEDNETYKITYAPATNTMLQNNGEFYNIPSTTYPSTNLDKQGFPGMYLTHYTQDEILGGEYYDGRQTLVSGSGKYLKNWYKFNGTGTLNGVVVNNNGKRVKKSGLRPCTRFASPRVLN